MRILSITFTFFLCLVLANSPSHASIEALSFETSEQREQYQALILELRCLVCQNQNLADSNAQLAQDLRSKTYEMVMQGESDEAILDYMQQRYGDFVLYRPRFNASNAVLWLGPFALLLITIAVLIMRIKRRQQEELIRPAQADNEATRLQVRNLLKNSPDLGNDNTKQESPDKPKSEN